MAAAQAKKLEAEADNLNQDTKAKEKQTLKLAEEITLAQQEIIKTKGEIALQGWSQRQLMTISDSELKSISEGNGWTKGWSFGTGQGTSSGESKQYGGGIGGKIGAEVLGTGGDIAANIQGNYGYSKNQSQNTNENKSENSGANTSKSETTSTSGSRNVIVWPKYDENGKLEKLYLYILTGDYKNIASEFRAD